MRWESEDSQTADTTTTGESQPAASMRWKSEDSQTDTELEALYQVHTASMRWKSEDSQTRSQPLLPLAWCFASACERYVMRLS